MRVKLFIQDVFDYDKAYADLYKEYIVDSNKKIDQKHLEQFTLHVKQLKLDKQDLVHKKTNFIVEDYSNTNFKNLLNFHEDILDNIYVVSANKKVEFYILYRDSKIISFHQLKKSGLAYFIEIESE